MIDNKLMIKSFVIINTLRRLLLIKYCGNEKITEISIPAANTLLDNSKDLQE